MNFKKSLMLLSLMCLSVTYAFAAPVDVFKGQKGEISIAGGTAHIPVMTEAAKKISTIAPDVVITIEGGGSGVGVKKVGEGIVDIGNTGRALKQEEINKYGLVSFPFAIDGVALAVNPKNTISELTDAQIREIFSGKINNWKQLGGEDLSINVYGREDGSGTRQTFDDLLLGKDFKITVPVNTVNSNGAMKTSIANDPGALGYVGIGHLDESIKGIVLNGVEPTQLNASTGAYKITRKLYMNTKGLPEGLTALFIDYLYSDEGADIIKNSGYIPLPRP